MRSRISGSESVLQIQCPAIDDVQYYQVDNTVRPTYECGGQ